MQKVKKGDYVRGTSASTKDEVMIKVDTDFDFGGGGIPPSVAGRVVLKNGRLSKRRAAILREDGWEPVPEPEVPTQGGVTEDLRAMKIGDEIFVPTSAYKIQSVRTVASNIGHEMGVRIRVEMAEGGCRVICLPKRQSVASVARTLAAQLRAMNVSDAISLEPDEYRERTVRSMVSTIAHDLGRRYTVNRTPTGCKVTRME